MDIIIFFTACAVAVISATLLNIRESRKEQAGSVASSSAVVSDMRNIPARPADQMSNAIGERAAA